MGLVRGAAGVGLMVILAMAGCSDSGRDGSGRDGSGGAPTAAANAGLGAAPTATPSVNVPRKVGEASFQTPSKNIACHLDAESARCDIGQKQWAPPPKPDDCQLAWGNGVAVERGGEATFTCAGDTLLGAGNLLPYGQSLRAGDFLCDSTATALRCSNVGSGHGFTLSVQEYQLF